jgi:hypothetical protein
MLWLLANLLPAQFFLRGSFADGAMQLVLVLASPEAAATESAACVLAIPVFLAAYTCCGRRREPDARGPILSTSVASTAGVFPPVWSLPFVLPATFAPPPLLLFAVVVLNASP